MWYALWTLEDFGNREGCLLGRVQDQESGSRNSDYSFTSSHDNFEPITHHLYALNVSALK